MIQAFDCLDRLNISDKFRCNIAVARGRIYSK